MNKVFGRKKFILATCSALVAAYFIKTNKDKKSNYFTSIYTLDISKNEKLLSKLNKNNLDSEPLINYILPNDAEFFSKKWIPDYLKLKEKYFVNGALIKTKKSLSDDGKIVSIFSTWRSREDYEMFLSEFKPLGIHNELVSAGCDPTLKAFNT